MDKKNARIVYNDTSDVIGLVWQVDGGFFRYYVLYPKPEYHQSDVCGTEEDAVEWAKRTSR